MQIEISRQWFGLTVTDTDSSYLLRVKKDNIGDLGAIYFMIPSPCKIAKETSIPVTARNICEYPSRLFPINPDHQYTEIGAGLAGFIPEVTRKSSQNSPKPICIDLFDYSLGYNLLKIAHANSNPNEQKLIEILIERHAIITDPSKVNLINSTLGEAIENNPKLIGKSDIVVDYCGPRVYPETEFNKSTLRTPENIREQLEENVKRLEKLLLRPNGLRITS